MRQPKTVAAYTHTSTAPAPAPSGEPGNYYVSVRDPDAHDGLYWLLLGPFKDDHAAALARVDEARAYCLANDGSGKAHFMAYGTCRMAHSYAEPGRLNAALLDTPTVGT